jgi:hypothetical protein
MAMTAAVPMTMPRLVSSERPLWTSRAPRATRREARKLIGSAFEDSGNSPYFTRFQARGGMKKPLSRRERGGLFIWP